ncbi:hypothetical protein BH10ACT7_BH10ACT7_20710 [soil metagenome]
MRPPKAAHRSITERGATLLLSVLAIIGMVGAPVILGPASPAAAEDYPTWGDVAAARNNESAAQASIREIEGLLAGLQAEAERTAIESEAKGTLWRAADAVFQEAALRAQNLQDQADTADAKATSSQQKAGQMAAQLARGGGGQDLVANLLTSASDPAELLYNLGLSGKISEQANMIYERALLDRNTAQALTDQADVAKAELDVLRIAAEKLFLEAQSAAIAAADALREQEDNQARLQQQLIVLKEKREATEADYLAGVRERIGSGASLAAGEISLSGWVRPVSGRITDSFGYRVSPTAGASSYHQGTDIGAGCGQPLYAASSGTVVYAGWNGGYGNFVMIDHGSGITTSYAHIQNGGILVSYGQYVDVATNIAQVGTTGTSTGCHSHFEVRSGGTAIDAEVFMQGQGITLG